MISYAKIVFNSTCNSLVAIPIDSSGAPNSGNYLVNETELSECGLKSGDTVLVYYSPYTDFLGGPITPSGASGIVGSVKVISPRFVVDKGLDYLG